MNSDHSRALARARRVVREYGLDAPSAIDIEAIAFDLGLLVHYAPLAGAAARLLRKGSRGVVRVSSRIDIPGQQRFCVAHELGHFLLHASQQSLSQCTAEDMLSWRSAAGLEPEANAFAAELLMPENLFRAHAARREPALSMVEALAEAFQTTITATLYRYVELGISVCALVASQDGSIRWFLPAPDFHFPIRTPGTRLDGRTCASSFFLHGAAKTEDDVPAEAWLSPDAVETSWTIREIMIPMPRFRSAMSLLWAVPGSPLDAS